VPAKQCGAVSGLRLVRGVVVSPDGTNVYVASARGGIVVLARNATTGALAQVPGGCISSTSSGACASAKALADPESLAISPDGQNVYVAARGSHAVAAFTR